jgi:hypothetical protein
MKISGANCVMGLGAGAAAAASSRRRAVAEKTIASFGSLPFALRARPSVGDVV